MENNRIFPYVAAAFVAATGLLWPWTGTAEAGDGLRAGDLKLNPRVKLSGSYDENIFRLHPDESGGDRPSGAPIFEIAPGLKISTMDATSVDLSFDGELAWEQYFSSERAIQTQSGLQGNGLFGLTLNPNGGLSLKLSEDLTYRNEPPPYPSATSWDRLVNSAGAGIIIHPGDEILNATLGYDYVVYRYFDANLRDANKDAHNFKLEFLWKFLPKTSFVIDGKAQLVRYQTEARGFRDGQIPNVDSTPITVRGGLSGLLTRRIQTRLLGGYATGLYEDGPSFNGPVARADITFKYGKLDLDNRLMLGYEREFNDSSIGNFYGYHRGIFEIRQNFMQKRLGLSLGAEFTHRAYADVETDTSRGLKTTQNPQGETVFFDDLEDNQLDITAGVHGQFKKWWRASVNYTFDANFTADRIDVPAANAEYLRSYQRHLVILSTTFEY